jgi:quercetin dioxygenase-like cupin family protein
MLVVRDAEQTIDTWRPGVETRMYCSSAVGASQLTIFEQWCAAGHGAPPHLHAVEEALRLLAGRALVRVGDDERELAPGDTVIIPAGVIHGFTNILDETLHVMAVLASPIFEARYIDPAREVRRWGPSS